MRRALCGVSLWVLAAASVSVLAPWSPARATPVQCGDVITSDTVLQADLDCSTGAGLVVGASNVVLDLNGHRLTGDPTNDQIGPGISVGNFDGVVIKDGVVKAFANGILMTDTDFSVIRHVKVKANVGIGVFMEGATNNRIRRTRSICNGEVGSGETCATSGADGFGIAVFANVQTNAPSLGNLVVANEVTRHDTGIIVDTSHGNLVKGNTVSENAGGIVIADGASHNRVRRNVVTGGLSGIFSDDTAKTGNLYARNRSSDHASAGVVLEMGSGSATVARNRTVRSNTGVIVDEAGVVVRGNVANFNVTLGIRAVAGVVDGGGNRAKGNGDPAQCTGVSCS